MAATAQIVHLTGFEIARGPAPDMNRQTSIGAGLHQRGIGDLGLAFGSHGVYRSGLSSGGNLVSMGLAGFARI